MKNALRLALVGVYTLVIGFPVILTSLIPGLYPAAMWLARTWIRWNLATFGVRVEIEGLENVPRESPVVFMSNHQSLFDIAALIETLPVEWRFVAKRELLRVPIFGWCVASTGQIIIDRGNREKAVASLERAADRIRAGVNVIVFPEGTRSPDGTLRAFKSGGFHLALQAGVPIVPVTVSGSHRIARKGSIDAHSGRIRITYGKPIPTHDVPLEEREQLKARVREAIARGYDPVLQGSPRIDPPLAAA